MQAAAVIVGWITVVGGLTLAGLWLRAGGGRDRDRDERPVPASTGRPSGPAGAAASAPEPDNAAGITPARPRVFSRAHVAAHGMLGLVAVALVSYTASGVPDSPALAAGIALAAVILAVVAGLGLFVKWKQARDSGDDALPESRLPIVIVAGHGLAAGRSCVGGNQAQLCAVAIGSGVTPLVQARRTRPRRSARVAPGCRVRSGRVGGSA